MRRSQSFKDLEEEHSRKRAQAVQRSWGTTVPGMLEEQRGGPHGWSTVREGERGRGEDEEGGGGQVVGGPGLP